MEVRPIPIPLNHRLSVEHRKHSCRAVLLPHACSYRYTGPGPVFHVLPRLPADPLSTDSPHRAFPIRSPMQTSHTTAKLPGKSGPKKSNNRVIVSKFSSSCYHGPVHFCYPVFVLGVQIIGSPPNFCSSFLFFPLRTIAFKPVLHD